MSDSGIQFRSQQFVADRNDAAGQAQMQGAAALGGSLAQAPMDFMRAKQARAQIAFDELRRDKLQQDLLFEQSLIANGLAESQLEAASLQNDLLREQVKATQTKQWRSELDLEVQEAMAAMPYLTGKVGEIRNGKLETRIATEQEKEAGKERYEARRQRRLTPEELELRSAQAELARERAESERTSIFRDQPSGAGAQTTPSSGDASVSGSKIPDSKQVAADLSDHLRLGLAPLGDKIPPELHGALYQAWHPYLVAMSNEILRTANDAKLGQQDAMRMAAELIRRRFATDPQRAIDSILKAAR